MVPGGVIMQLAKLDDSLDHLCAALKCTPEQLRECVKEPTRYYSPIEVRRRRRSRRPRSVVSVEDPLRRLHRTIALWLRPHVESLPDCVQGFRRGRGVYSNARCHSGGPAFLVNVDLVDFFGGIALQDVRNVFQRVGAGYQIALTLARLTTLDGRLPQGTRCSPAIANLAAARLDARIMREVGGRCYYTRYADDLTFSGEWAPTYEQIAQWAEESGFELRSGSYRSVRRGGGQYVTGLYVGSERPRLPRRTRREAKRLLYFARKGDPEAAIRRTFRLSSGVSPRAKLHGFVGRVAAVESERALLDELLECFGGWLRPNQGISAV